VRKEYSWSGSTWTLTNEVHNLFMGAQVIQERNSSNVPQVGYTLGLGRLARTDIPLSLNPQPSTSPHAYYHTDGRENVTILIDVNGQVQARYLYDPFGNLLAKSGPLADANLYRFAGQEVHAQSGLIRCHFRYYDPNLQRWLNRDPIGLLGGLNLHAYVDNDPVDDADPLGLWSSCLNPQSAQLLAEIESGAFESQAVAAQLAREAAIKATIRAATEQALKKAAANAAREATINAGLASGMTVIALGGGDMYSPPLPKPSGGSAPPRKPPCTTRSATPFGPGDNEGAARGREAHKWWQPPSGFQKNFRFNTGEIADAVNLQTRQILEMKTSAADVGKGWEQIARYIKAAEDQLGGKWTGKVVDQLGQPW
jgi:RHS repeat-associated protein